MKFSSNNVIYGRLSRAYELPYVIRGAVSAVCGAVKNSRVVIHSGGKIRRFWLVHFGKEYIRAQMRVRQGECRQCGMCCNLLFTCPALTKQGQCLFYGVCRPGACKVFPIDRRDIDEVSMCGGHCGYHFEDKKPLMIE